MKKLRALSIASLCGIGCVAAARTYLRQSRYFSYAGKVAIVTGGARGLGLEIARLLVAQGAHIAICARTEEDLERAHAELSAIAPDTMAIKCDVRFQHEIDEMVQKVQARWGRVDILFNVAGIIGVGPLESMTKLDFRDNMATHFWGPLLTMGAVIPLMKQQGWGRIVNVASMGGKRAIPHMIPYDASKFALVGLSQGIRAELVKDNIYVTTVCPSVMRTGSPRNAIFKGQHTKEYAWFKIGDSIPLISTNSKLAAKKVLRACQHGDAELIFPFIGRLATIAGDIAPNLMAEAMAIMNQMLPKMGGIGTWPARGYESTSKLSESFLTDLTKKAAIRNNQMADHPLLEM